MSHGQLSRMSIVENGIKNLEKRCEKLNIFVFKLEIFWVWNCNVRILKSPSHNSYRAQFIHSYLHNSYRRLNLQNSYQKLKSGCHNSYHFRHQPVTIHTKIGVSIHNSYSHFLCFFGTSFNTNYHYTM